MTRFYLLSLVAFLVWAVEGAAQDAAEPSHEKTVRVVYALSHSPAQDVSSTLERLFGDSVRIVPEIIGNSLLIEMSAGSVDEVMDIVERLDRQPASVQIQALVVGFAAEPPARDSDKVASGPTDDLMQQIEQLRVKGSVQVLERVELTTLSNQEAVVEMKRVQPVRTGSQVTRSGPTASFSKEQLGVTLRVVPRVGADKGIAMSIGYEKTELAPSGDDQNELPAIIASSVQSTVQIASGHSVVLGGGRSASVDDSKGWKLIVSASVVSSEGKE